ncbi:MAG TPA: c-type cytochrome [Chthoniobacterales bacterium]|nr:c-type cytochrome [Chthoniobacterales bacterium]
MMAQHVSVPLAVLAALTVALLTVACNRSRNTRTSSAGAASEPSSAPPAIRYEAHMWAGGISPPTRELRNPHEGDTDNARAGARLFASMNCDGCHGDAGSGWVGPSLADGRWRYGGRDEEIFSSIFYGRSKGMPAYGGVIGSEGVWMLVNYLRSLPKPDVVPTESWIETPASAGAKNTQIESNLVVGQSGGRADFETLLRNSGCSACHAINKKVVGPAFRDVAAKYRRQSNAEQRLIESVKNGSEGLWGDVPMPPNASLGDEDLHSIVKRILSLK